MSNAATLKPGNSGNPGCMTIISSGCSKQMRKMVEMFPALCDGGYEGRLHTPGQQDIIDAKFLKHSPDEGLARLWYETMPYRWTYVKIRRDITLPKEPGGQTGYEIHATISRDGYPEIARLAFSTTWKQYKRFDLRYWAARAVTQALRA